MGKRDIKKWKEASKSGIEKSNSLLWFFSDQIYWANKMFRCSFIWGNMLSLEVKKNIFSQNKFKENHMFCWKNVVKNGECAEIKRDRWNRQRQNKSVTKTFRKKGTATPWGWCWKLCTWAISSAAMFLETVNCDTWEQANSEQPAARALLAN